MLQVNNHAIVDRYYLQ